MKKILQQVKTGISSTQRTGKTALVIKKREKTIPSESLCMLREAGKREGRGKKGGEGNTDY